MSENMALSRKMWRVLEPIHGMVYFAPEARAAYEAIGVTGRRMGYFASRAAAMGAVPAEMVISTFFNFNPALVRRVIPEAWRRAEPADIVDARFTAVDRALRRLLGDENCASPAMKEAADLARAATDGCTLDGRPLYAAHASLDWPDDPHLVLWHAISLLREFRGDGHIAALTYAGIGGCEALVQHAAAGDVPRPALQASRAWSDEEWEAARNRLEKRGLVDATGAFTPEGAAQRALIEARTDELAMGPWDVIGDEGCTRLREIARPYSKAIVESGIFLVTNWDD